MTQIMLSHDGIKTIKDIINQEEIKISKYYVGGFIQMTREQIEKMIEFSRQFDNKTAFVITETTNGIGPIIRMEAKKTLDLTDYSQW
jgi:Holliday junction resolvase